jgi:uncharacterized protein YdaU (DUF1376 family)
MSKPAKGDRLAWLKFDPAAFLVDVGRLPPQEVGIYIQLLCHYWVRQGEIHETERLAISLGLRTDAEREALECVLSLFFPDGRHAELDRLLGESADKVATARENGRKGGRRSSTVPPATAPASGPHAAPPTQHEEGDETPEF